MLDLGSLPAADYFPPLDAPLPDPAWPLRLYLCEECELVQLGPGDYPDAELPTAVESATSVAHAAASAHAVIEAENLRAGSTVIELDSHHGGSWLPEFVRQGLEPREANATADLVVDVHCIAHAPEIDGPMAAHAARIAPGGRLVLEFHHLLPLVQQGQIDTIRHGHWVYLSLLALRPLLARHGLTMTRVDEVPVFGGSARVTARPIVDQPAIDPSIDRVLQAETSAGLNRAATFAQLGADGHRAAATLRHHLQVAQAEGRSVAGYGAPSKAPVLLGLAGVDATLLPYTVDLSPAKQGCRIPGVGIPIESPTMLAERRPDEVVILTWDIADEVTGQLSDMAGPDWRPRYFCPLPAPRYVGDLPSLDGGRVMTRSQGIAKRLRDLVPGGAHTYAKGDDQYPADVAPIIDHGRGAHVWDVDGNEYIEYGSGLRAVALGHAHPAITEAVEAQLRRGANFARPAVIELDAAEAFLDCVPTADMVKFAKNGSDATTAATRLARSITGRPLVAICGDQPFFSTDDWFIATTPMRSGIPSSIRQLTVRFPYGDLEATEQVLREHEGEVACLVMEAAAGGLEPTPGYLAGMRDLAHRYRALLVFDEMITGFRWSEHGAQGLYGVTPDLSTFGKALGNGFSVSALAGRREYMERGGVDHEHDRVFLLSTTHGAEAHALAAAIAVMEVYRREGITEQLHAIGDRLAAGVREVTEGAGVADHVLVRGRSCNLVFATLDTTGQPSQEYRTLFMRALLQGGVLAPSFVVSAALSEADIRRTVDVVAGACQIYRRALDREDPTPWLGGRPVRPVFRARG